MVATAVRIDPGWWDSSAGNPVPLWSAGGLERSGCLKLSVISVKGQVDAETSRSGAVQDPLPSNCPLECLSGSGGGPIVEYY